MAKESRQAKFKKAVSELFSVTFSKDPTSIPADSWQRPKMMRIMVEALEKADEEFDEDSHYVNAAFDVLTSELRFAPEETRSRGGRKPDQRPVYEHYEMQEVDRLRTDVLKRFLERQIALAEDVAGFRQFLPRLLRSKRDVWHFLSSPQNALLSLARLEEMGLDPLSGESGIMDEKITLHDVDSSEPYPFYQGEAAGPLAEPVYTAIVQTTKGKERVTHPLRNRVTLGYTPVHGPTLEPKMADTETGPMEAHSFVASQLLRDGLSSIKQKGHSDEAEAESRTFIKTVTADARFAEKKKGPIYGYSGTVVGEALRIAQRLSGVYSLAISDAVLVLLTGWLPPMHEIQCNGPALFPVYSLEDGRRLYEGKGRIKYDLYPKASNEQVSLHYQTMQSYFSPGSNRPLKAHNLELFAYVNERMGKKDENGRPWTWQLLAGGWKRQLTQEEWAELRGAVDKGKVKSASGQNLKQGSFDYRNFRTTYYRILESLIPVHIDYRKKQISAEEAKQMWTSAVRGTSVQEQ